MPKLTLFAVAIICTIGAVLPARTDPIPSGWQAERMTAIGYTDLGGHPGPFKLAIKHTSNGRWYLYAAHLWDTGFSIVDVTDASNPRFVKFVGGPDPNSFGMQVSLHDDVMITALEKSFPGWGKDPSKSKEEGLLIWSIKDPENPKLLSHWKTGADGTHRNSYPGGRYAFLAASMPGFKRYSDHLVILDVSDPTAPKIASEWWTPGQKLGEGPTDGSDGFHGPPDYSPDGRTLTMAYSGSLINLDISDIVHPKVLGQLKINPPFQVSGATSLHSALKLPGGFVEANSEQMTEGCDTRALPFAGIIDNRDMAKPRLISTFPTPRPPADAPYRNFCEKGGRFGPHNVNQETHSPDVEKPGALVYMTWFNAGLRVFDVSDPYLPTETGWFIPPQPTVRRGPLPANKLVSQTEDVLVDARGNLYISDKQWGIFVLRYTGKGQPLPTAR